MCIKRTIIKLASITPQFTLQSMHWCYSCSQCPLWIQRIIVAFHVNPPQLSNYSMCHWFSVDLVPNLPGARCWIASGQTKMEIVTGDSALLLIRQLLQSKFAENNFGISPWNRRCRFWGSEWCIPWEVASWWPGEGRGPWRPLQSIKQPGQDNGPSLQIWLLLVTGWARNLGLPTS